MIISKLYLHLSSSYCACTSSWFISIHIFFKILLSKLCGMLIGPLQLSHYFSAHILSIATIKQPLTPVVLLSLQCVAIMSLNPLYSLYYSWQGMREKGSRWFKPVSICHGRNRESKIHSYLSTINSLKSLSSEVIFEGSLELKVRHCSESYITTLLQHWTGLSSGLAL